MYKNSAQLHKSFSDIFSQRQKELILKKMSFELTVTEILKIKKKILLKNFGLTPYLNIR